MPQLSPIEILVCAVVALIVFGPDKLPDIARRVGRTAAQVRRMAAEFRDEFADVLEAADTPDADESDDDGIEADPPQRPRRRPGPRSGS